MALKAWLCVEADTLRVAARCEERFHVRCAHLPGMSHPAAMDELSDPVDVRFFRA